MKIVIDIISLDYNILQEGSKLHWLQWISVYLHARIYYVTWPLLCIYLLCVFCFQLPAAVGEEPNFSYDERVSKEFFKPNGVSTF